MSHIPCPAEGLYSCTVRHCSYLLLKFVLYHEVSGVCFWACMCLQSIAHARYRNAHLTRLKSIEAVLVLYTVGKYSLKVLAGSNQGSMVCIANRM